MLIGLALGSILPPVPSSLITASTIRIALMVTKVAPPLTLKCPYRFDVFGTNQMSFQSL